MINSLIAVKRNMSSSYDTRGRRVGTTVLEIQPNIVTQVKTSESKDGYNAIQVGLGNRKYMKKPQMGHLKKNNIDQNVQYFREIRTDQVEDLNPGQKIKASDIFLVGDLVKISGVSKGRGFAGGMKRHGFHGGPKTHGQSDRHRAPGSIGATTTPGRVYKGKNMAGHFGVEGVSIKNLEVVSLDKQNNLLTLKGGVPGFNGSLLVIEKIGHVKGHTPEVEEVVEEQAEPVVEESAAAQDETQNERVEQLDSSEQTESAEQPGEDSVEDTTNAENTETPSEDVKTEKSEGEKE